MREQLRHLVLNLLYAIALLTVALLLALRGAAELNRGDFASGAAFHILALLLSVVVLFKLLPRIAAARSKLRGKPERN